MVRERPQARSHRSVTNSAGLPVGQQEVFCLPNNPSAGARTSQGGSHDGCPLLLPLELLETYLLVFPDEEGRKGAWDRFRKDAAWIKLRAIPEYADKEIVSRITNILLKPMKCSEI